MTLSVYGDRTNFPFRYWTWILAQVEELLLEDSRIDQYPKVIKGEAKVVLEWQGTNIPPLPAPLFMVAILPNAFAVFLPQHSMLLIIFDEYACARVR